MDNNCGAVAIKQADRSSFDAGAAGNGLKLALTFAIDLEVRQVACVERMVLLDGVAVTEGAGVEVTFG